MTGLAEALAGLPRVVDLLAARAEEHDREGTFPYQGVEAVHEAGLLTLTVGQRYGGPGAGLADLVPVLAELGRGDASVAVLAAHTLLLHAEQARTGAWPAPGYRKLLGESRRGPALVNTVCAEAADPGGQPAAAARRDGDAWLLTGRKTDCPGAEALVWIAVRARTEDAEPRLGTFLVRGDSPGVEIEPGWEQLGLRAGGGHEVVLKDVRVPAEAVLRLPRTEGGTETERAAAALSRAWHDLALAAVHLGVARAARDWLVGFLRRSHSSEAPMSARQCAAVGEIESSLIGAEELLAGLAVRIDRGDSAAVARTTAARLLADRASTGVVQQAVTLTGSAGLSRRHPLERFLRDVLSGRAGFPADEVVLEALGRAVLDPAAG